MPKIVLALNTENLETAINWAEKFKGIYDVLKIGLPLYLKHGVESVRMLRPYSSIFLDLKLHDIPDVVELSLRTLPLRDVDFLTVHATGGKELLLKTKSYLDGFPTKILGVSLLTSISEEEAKIIFRRDPQEFTMEIADLLVSIGIHGIVCSPLEANRIKTKYGDNLIVVTPGIRLKSQKAYDQRRFVFLDDTLVQYADYLVIGRTLTHTDDPKPVLEEIFKLKH